MTTHVFIVDYNTLKIHLEHLFAGTGAGDDFVDFNNSPLTNLKYGKENKLSGMMADALRIRKKDKIIFYLQQNAEQKIHEGKFFGIFEAIQDYSFLDDNDNEQYLKNELEKSLTFRTLLQPYKIYSAGVTEWEALDEIKCIQSPHQMLWSLIYRKLKGNRGNTMITDYESERLCHLIKQKNNQQQLIVNGKKLSFDKQQQKIICLDECVDEYKGRVAEINILPRLIEKYKANKAFESHLQAYIVQNIGTNNNLSLDSSLFHQRPSIEWIGNEVSCGVGMQRIDVMISYKASDDIDERFVMPIELKGRQIYPSIVDQLQRYVNWIEQYYLPNRISYIKPCLICKKTDNKAQTDYRDTLERFEKFNLKNNKNCERLNYVEYELEDDDLFFQSVSY